MNKLTIALYNMEVGDLHEDNVDFYKRVPGGWVYGLRKWQGQFEGKQIFNLAPLIFIPYNNMDAI